MDPDTERPQPLPPELYTEEYFLSACEGYEEFLASEGEHLSRRLAAAFAHAAVAPGMRVLDVGCGRGEILRHCARLGASVYGVDYAPAALRLARRLAASESGRPAGLYRSDAKALPFGEGVFDRVLRPGGKCVVHTAPNRWYDVYAYPLVRLVRTALGRGADYPRNPRALNVAANVDVHVNEQDLLSLRRVLRRAGFGGVRVWLDSPPQARRENVLFRALRHVAFDWPPFRWFFEREVFAVAQR